MIEMEALYSKNSYLKDNYEPSYSKISSESQNGGNHIRYWNQSSTNAMFIAASAEKSKAG